MPDQQHPDQHDTPPGSADVQGPDDDTVDPSPSEHGPTPPTDSPPQAAAATGTVDDQAQDAPDDAADSETEHADEVDDAGGFERSPADGSPPASAGESRTSMQSRPVDADYLPPRRTANDDNATMIGELQIFYSDRTVSLPLDGDAGLRAVAAWVQNKPAVWEDVVDPVTSTATVSWAAISLEGILSMLWIPGLPRRTRPQRMAVDPITG